MSITAGFSVIITAFAFANFSWHSTCGSGCNQNNNPTYGVDFTHRTGQYMLLSTNNTHSKLSELLAKIEQPLRSEYVKFGYFYGGVTGYTPLPVPFAAPLLTLGPVDMTCLSDFKTTVCAAVLKWRF